MVVDGGSVNKKWTDLLLNTYRIKNTTITPYRATANEVIERKHRPMDDVLSKLKSCPYEPKTMGIGHLQTVLWADRITVKRMTGHLRSCHMVCHDAVFSMGQESLT